MHVSVGPIKGTTLGVMWRYLSCEFFWVLPGCLSVQPESLRHGLMAMQGSAVSLQSDSEPLQLARGGKAHSWDATATRMSGRRPSASRSMDVRASIEPQVSSILELEPPALGTDQCSEAGGSLNGPASVVEAAASLSAPSSWNEEKGSPRRIAAVVPQDVSPSGESGRRVGSSAVGPSMLEQGLQGSAGLAARSALYTPARLKDEQKQQQ